MQILGLDISKASVSACLLTEKPTEPRQFYYDCDFHKFEATAFGIRGLLALIGGDIDNTIAVMEPTGVNYQILWGTQLARAGVEVRLVGHKELRSFREHHLGLPDKDDDADALALAIYGWDYLEVPRRFVQVRSQTIVEIRRLVLRLSHLNRVQSPIINRARQDLAWQFPEAALVRSVRLGEKVPLLWGWLCGQRHSVKYDLMLEKSIGLGLTDELRRHAARICDIQREEMVLEFQLSKLVAQSQFLPDRKVFARFGFGRRVEALLLSQIYPFENYLAADGKPDVKIRNGRKSGKPTKRHLSLRRFGEIMDAEKASGPPVRLVRSRVAAKAVKLLFKELTHELVYSQNPSIESEIEYQVLLE